MGYTPRQLSAFMILAQERQKTELAHQLSIGALAARGDKDDLKKQLKELTPK